MKYVLIIISLGDGSTDYGRRVTSLRFKTNRARNQAAEQIRKINPDSAVIEIDD